MNNLNTFSTVGSNRDHQRKPIAALVLFSILLLLGCNDSSKHHFYIIIDTSEAVSLDAQKSIEPIVQKFIYDAVELSSPNKFLSITEIAGPDAPKIESTLIDLSKASLGWGAGEQAKIVQYKRLVRDSRPLAKLLYLVSGKIRGSKNLTPNLLQNPASSVDPNVPESPVYSRIIESLTQIEKLGGEHTILIISDFEDNLLDPNLHKIDLVYDQNVIMNSNLLKNDPVIVNEHTKILVGKIIRINKRTLKVRNQVALDTANWFFTPRIKGWSIFSEKNINKPSVDMFTVSSIQ